MFFVFSINSTGNYKYFFFLPKIKQNIETDRLSSICIKRHTWYYFHYLKEIIQWTLRRKCFWWQRKKMFDRFQSFRAANILPSVDLYVTITRIVQQFCKLNSSNCSSHIVTTCWVVNVSHWNAHSHSRVRIINFHPEQKNVGTKVVVNKFGRICFGKISSQSSSPTITSSADSYIQKAIWIQSHSIKKKTERKKSIIILLSMDLRHLFSSCWKM